MVFTHSCICFVFQIYGAPKNKNMWLNRRLPPSEVDKVLGDGWNVRQTFHIGDTISCRVSPNSISISYQISRQSLVLGYDYRRWRRELGQWLPLDSEDACPEFELEINIHNIVEPRHLIVTTNWTLKDVRESLEFLDEAAPDFRFKIDS